MKHTQTHTIKQKIAVRTPDVRLRSIDKRRADEAVFFCMCMYISISILEINKK